MPKPKNNHGSIDQRLRAVAHEEDEYNRCTSSTGASEFCAFSGPRNPRKSGDQESHKSYARATAKPGLVHAQLKENVVKQTAFGSKYRSLPEEPMDSSIECTSGSNASLQQKDVKVHP